MIKKILSLLLVMFLSVQVNAQTSKSKFMRNYIVTKYPKYTFQDETTSALLIVDGKKTDINGLSTVSRKMFSKLTFHNKNLNEYIQKYGNSAKGGVFEIETKNHLAKMWLSEIIAMDTSNKLKQMISSRGFDYSRLMIIINGRELNTKFFEEPKIDIKTISKMNLESFGGIYGGMLTIEAEQVALYSKSNTGTSILPTTVAIEEQPKENIRPFGFEIRLPSKNSQANASETTPTLIPISKVSINDEITKISKIVLPTTTLAISNNSKTESTSNPITKETLEVSTAETPKPDTNEKLLDNKVYPFQAVDVMATFPSCETEQNRQAKYVCFQRTLMKHVIKNFKYPTSAQEDGIQGRVIVKFVIQKDGTIADISVIRGVNKELDKEAIRIVTKIPNIEPAKVDGEAVKVSTMLPITFKLR